jgi:2-dehydro-3-deoxyphosphogluconate aldolase/(4S)-4-hydroxy-2-oxoglutarate aldolase
MTAKEFIRQYRVVPVMVFGDLSEVRPKLSAMCKGGLPIAEITYRTACAGEAIRIAIDEFPEMLVGAGTVINGTQCREALALGAKFIVSPGFCTEAAELCRAQNVPYLGGCVTPTEIMTALSYGCDVIKFFPASVFGGLAAMKALSAAFPAASFLPTGGVSEKNLAEFLAWDKIFAVGGSWMMKGSPAEITEKCRAAVEIAKNV